jgi:hypothetical protein
MYEYFMLKILPVSLSFSDSLLSPFSFFPFPFPTDAGLYLSIIFVEATFAESIKQRVA